MAAALISHPLGQVLPSLTPGRTSMARRVPVGVVGVICPWNFPVVLPARSVGPALALGNAVILKSDPNTPITGGVLTARIFEEAGLPEGVLHVMGGGAEVGQAMIEDPNVRMISFTGSTATGRKVGEAAGRSLKRVVLELGGNSPLVVLEDADIEAASSAGAWGSFLHQGQICLAVSRHLVHESIADDYVKALAERASHLPVGNPDTERGRARADHQPEAGRAGRADRRRQRVAGRRPGHRRQARGPVLRAHRARRRDPVDAGLHRRDLRPGGARSSRSATTPRRSSWRTRPTTGWSRRCSPARTQRAAAVGEQLHAGMVHVNGTTINEEPPAPFGGFGQSSNGGHFGGVANLELWTEWQWVTSQDKAAPFPF